MSLAPQNLPQLMRAVDPARLIQAALSDGTRRGITKLLESIALQTHSFGCVLWRAKKDQNVTDSDAELTMLASWFAVRPHTSKVPQNDFIGIRTIKVIGSAVGDAALRSKNGTVIRSFPDGCLNGDNLFLNKFLITQVAAHRFTFKDKRTGVVSIYRCSQRHSDASRFHPEHFCAKDYGEPEKKSLSEIAKVVPLLYQAVRQHAATDLLVRVGKIVRDSSLRESQLVKRVGEAIAATFDTVETSIFLEDESNPEHYICAWTNKGPHSDNTKQSVLTPSVLNGFTPLALEARRAVRIHDTMNSEVETAYWRNNYNVNFKPRIPAGVSGKVDHYFGNPNPRPPYSLLVVPLQSGDRLIGCLRCWVVKIGPAYFSSDDEALLRLAGDNLSHAVASKRQENRRERAFVEMAGGAYRAKGNQDNLYLAYLTLVNRVLQGTHVNTIRLVEGDALFYHAFPRSMTNDVAIQASFPLNGSSLGARAIKLKKQVCATKKQKPDPKELLEQTDNVIVTPIVLDGKAVGVLDVRARAQGDLPSYTRSLLHSLCQLLSAQISKVAALEKVREAEKRDYTRDLKAIQERFSREKAMLEAFEDVSHQIKSPLAEAARRARQLYEANERNAMAKDINAIAGLLKRAELTAKLIGLFAAFARGESVNITGEKIEAVTLVKMVGEIILNQSVKLDPDKNIRFRFDDDSVYKSTPVWLHADPELLYQAISNLADNAIKYSYRNTTILLSSGKTKSNRFFISVQNKGLPISRSETILLKLRKTRGPLAKYVTGEGNGLGLFIVDKIMQAHRGELLLQPTNNSGVTDVRLIFNP